MESVSRVGNLGEGLGEECRVLAAVVEVEVPGLDDDTRRSCGPRYLEAPFERSTKKIGIVPTPKICPVLGAEEGDNVGRVGVLPAHVALS